MFKKILLSLALAISSSVFAFTPPNIVNVTVGFAPGSGNELSFRKIASIVEQQNSINFVINNKPGADELIALDYFGRLSPTKGDQLYIISQNNQATLEAWFPNKLKYTPLDFSLVTNIAKSPLAIIANVNSPTNTPKDLLDRIKNTKSPITFGLGSAGQRLMFEFMMEHGNGNADLVKSMLYKGPAQALQDIAGNQVEFGILPTAIAAPMAAGGKIKFIALASEFKLERLPNVPLMKDYIKNLNYYAAWGIALPVGSTPEQVKFYQDLFVTAIRSPEAKKFFDENMMLTFPEEQNPTGLKNYMLKVREQWYPYAKRVTFE